MRVDSRSLDNWDMRSCLVTNIMITIHDPKSSRIDIHLTFHHLNLGFETSLVSFVRLIHIIVQLLHVKSGSVIMV